MASTLLLPALVYDCPISEEPCFGATPFAFRQTQNNAALPLLGCLFLMLGLYLALPWLLLEPVSGQLLGRWQLQTLIRDGRRVPLSGEYEFRSDYTTRPLTGNVGTRAGLWIIRTPLKSATPQAHMGMPNTTIVTTSYQFIDTLMHHIDVHVLDQQGTPDTVLWPGPGIYDVTLITTEQLILRRPDAEAGGWIVLECTKIGDVAPF